MSRTRIERQRYLESVVGDAGKVKVWLSGDWHWNYQVKCRTCWARQPRGNDLGEKVTILAATTSEAVSRWLQHEAAYHGEVS